MSLNPPQQTRLDASSYDRFWREWPDFNRHHPGARHRRRLILKALEGLAFRSVLDVGCGSGELLALLGSSRSSDALELHGSDLSEEGLKVARKLVPGLQTHALDLVSGALGRKFDLVLCSEVIEHLDQQPRAFTNLASMVQDGGHLLITCPAGPIHRTEKHFGHLHHPSREELDGWARGSGLTPVRYLNWGFPAYRALKWATNLGADWAIREFATTQYSWSKKALSALLYGACFASLRSHPLGCQQVAVFKRYAAPF